MITDFGDRQKTGEKDENIEFYRYTSTAAFNGQDVGLAYGQQYKIFGANCYGCDTKRAMENIIMDGKIFSATVDTVPSENFIEIEPVTGIMTRMRRSFTVVYSNS